MSIEVASGDEFTERRKQESTMSKTTALGMALVVALSGGAVAVVAMRSVAGGSALPTPFHMPDSAGSSSVTLADGRRLELRGEDGALIVDGRDVFKLAASRRFASLTVMPTGQVLIWGGIDSEGRLIEAGEWFEPSTGAVVTTGRLGLPVRAGHTLNVLSDGTLAMTGGWGQGNVPAHDVAVWRPLDRHLDVVAGDTAHARLNARGSLLADGTLQVHGGVDEIGRPVHGDWRYGVANGLAAKAHGIAASYPTRDKNGASPIGPLALRFADPIDVTQLNGTVSLLGPNGVVKTRVVAAEGGRLAFVQLPDELYPAARYTIFVQGLHTASGDTVPYEAIGFTTKAARTGVVLAGEGKRPGVPAAEESGEPPVYVMAGAGKVAPCKPIDAFHLCRNKGEVKDGAFYPGQDNVATASGGHWRLYADRQTLPDTRERESNLPRGNTALIGQVRRIDESPVANVEITVAGQHVRTDAQGVFVLRDLLPGRNELFVDGGPAGDANTEYGRFIVGADVAASTVNHMPYVMYLPRVLARDKIALPSPTIHETVLTHPDMPGLELRIPAGAVFKDRNGKVLTEIAIVPTPVDHAPFPLPDNFPTYFTIQPGDAVVQGMTPDAAKGIQVVYPNYGKQKPADKADFWVYSAEKGWDMYGAGHVSADASQLVADKSTRLVWALGAGASQNQSQAEGDMQPDNKCESKPVDLQTGRFFHRWTDLSVDDVIPISVDRTSNALASYGSPFGLGSGTLLALTISSPAGFDQPRIVLSCGEVIRFDLATGSPTWPLVGTVWQHRSTNSKFLGATMQFLNDSTPEGAHWVITLKDGSEYRFDRHAPNKLASFTDRFGNTVRYEYSSGLLTGLVSPNGRTIGISYNNKNLIDKVFDQLGRTVHYEYQRINTGPVTQDAYVLNKVTFPDGTSESYSNFVRKSNGLNVETWLMKSMTDRKGNVWVDNEYDDQDRVVRQTLADGSSYTFEYEVANGSVGATVVTNPAGRRDRTTFDPASKYPTEETVGLGTELQSTSTFSRASSGLLLAYTDNLGRVTRYDYDAVGNVVSVTELAGTKDAATYKYRYTPGSQLESAMDPLGHETRTHYADGCPIEVVDSLGKSTYTTCNSQGRITSVRNAVGGEAHFIYAGGDLVEIKNPLGQSRRFAYDVVGRRTSATKEDGSATLVAYDAMDRSTAYQDATGGSTNLTYDENSNLLAVSLPGGSSITYQYDLLNRLVARNDLVGAKEQWTYGANGKVATYTDRKGQATSYEYNLLAQLIRTVYSDGLRVDSTYDSESRLLKLADSTGASLSWTYDGRDSVLSESDGNQAIVYTYDLATRRTGMQLGTEAPVLYEYDDADQLKEIDQGTRKVALAYDDFGQRTGLSVNNTLSATYGYDLGGRLTELKYKNAAGSMVRDFSYSYDTVGNRVALIASVVKSLLPLASNDAVFDRSGRLTHLHDRDYQYDANGNLISDGVRTYLWNAKDQLTSVRLNGAEVLGYTYDLLGRRSSKNDHGVVTAYSYDGDDVAAVHREGTTQSYLNGPWADERYAVTESGVDHYFVADGLGSTSAIVGADGSVEDSYDYEPFGRTEHTLGSSQNSFLFTGRERDDDDLYFYRARYYLPSIGRFASEDPIGMQADWNQYAYVGNSPTMYADPWGNAPGGGGKGERGRTRSPNGTDDPGKHWKDDPDRPGWGWQKDQNGKKIYKKKPPYLCPPTDQKKFIADEMPPPDHPESKPPSLGWWIGFLVLIGLAYASEMTNR